MFYYHIRIVGWGKPDPDVDHIARYLPVLREEALRYDGYLDLDLHLPSLGRATRERHMKALTSIIAASLLLSPVLAHEREEPPEGAVARTVLPDVKMPIMNEDSRSTLVCAMYALLPALGQKGWSIPRLEALTGYAFYFRMQEGGEKVFDDDLDWGLAMHVLDIFGQAKVYDADKNSDVDLPALKAGARDAVVASLEVGLPSLVWAPLSLEQRGKVRFACWGLIVGYNPGDQTYLIRQPAEKLDYPVRFDAIGFGDPSDWFRVGTFEPKDLDDHALHLGLAPQCRRFRERHSLRPPEKTLRIRPPTSSGRKRSSLT